MQQVEHQPLGAQELANSGELWLAPDEARQGQGQTPDHPDAVKRLLQGQVAANDLIKNDPAKAQNLVGQGINNATGKPLAADVIAASFKNLTFTNDPIATSLRKSAKDAEAAGLLKAVDLKGIYNLKLLNQVLTKQGEPTVKS